MRRILLPLLAVAFLSSPARADTTVGEITVGHGYSRPSLAGAKNGSAFVTLQNKGSAADRLVKASSDVAAAVELHNHIMEGDVMRMRMVPAIDLPAGQTVTLAPGALHIMLLGLKRPLKDGDKFPVTLTFEKAGSATVEISVEKRDAPMQGHDHKH